jgi:hypothetical protein
MSSIASLLVSVTTFKFQWYSFICAMVCALIRYTEFLKRQMIALEHTNVILLYSDHQNVSTNHVTISEWKE